MSEWVPDEAAISREILSLMHQPVRIGDRVVGRVESVEAPRREYQFADRQLNVTVRVESPFIKRSILQIPYSTAPVKKVEALA